MEYLCLGGDPGEFQCCFCGRSYKYKKNLQRHQNLECGVEPKFQCPVCQAKYTSKQNLDKHARAKHGLELPKMDSINRMY